MDEAEELEVVDSEESVRVARCLSLLGNELVSLVGQRDIKYAA